MGKVPLPPDMAPEDLERAAPEVASTQDGVHKSTSAEAGNTNVPAVQRQGGIARFEGSDIVEENQLDYEQAMKEIDQAQSENIAAGEVKISRLSIAQPGTPEVAEHLDGWQGGMIFDGTSREVVSEFGKPPWLLARGVQASDIKACAYLPIVFMFRLPSEYVMWPSKEEREQGIKQFHWKDLDPRSPRVVEGMWKPKGTWTGEGAPPVTEHLNLLAFGLNSLDCSVKTGLIVGSFSRTSFRTGEKLVSALQQHKLSKLPWWGRVYYLFTEFHKEDGNPYYTYAFAKGPKLVEFAQPPALNDHSILENSRDIFKNCFETARALSDRSNGRALQEMMINAAQLQEEVTGGSAGGTGGDNGSEYVNNAASEEPAF